MQTFSRRSFVTVSTACLLAGPVFAKGPGISTNRAGVAIRGYDTRAYWSASEARVGAETYVVEWQGVPWRFESQGEADAFAADPARYAPKFGGFCTRAMSLKKVVNGDPEVWRIYEDGLYLFARPVGRDYFDKGEAAMIAKAQAHWDSLG